MTGRGAARRVLGGATIGYGVVLAASASRIASRTRVARAPVRLLSARYVLQGTAVLAGGPHWARLAGLTDATHALSMLPLLAWPGCRVAGLVSGVAAAGLARVSWWAAG